MAADLSLESRVAQIEAHLGLNPALEPGPIGDRAGPSGPGPVPLTTEAFTGAAGDDRTRAMAAGDTP